MLHKVLKHMKKQNGTSSDTVQKVPLDSGVWEIEIVNLEVSLQYV